MRVFKKKTTPPQANGLQSCFCVLYSDLIGLEWGLGLSILIFLRCGLRHYSTQILSVWLEFLYKCLQFMSMDHHPSQRGGHLASVIFSPNESDGRWGLRTTAQADGHPRWVCHELFLPPQNAPVFSHAPMPFPVISGFTRLLSLPICVPPAPVPSSSCSRHLVLQSVWVEPGARSFSSTKTGFLWLFMSPGRAHWA